MQSCLPPGLVWGDIPGAQPAWPGGHHLPLHHEPRHELRLRDGGRLRLEDCARPEPAQVGRDWAGEDQGLGEQLRPEQGRDLREEKQGPLPDIPGQLPGVCQHGLLSLVFSHRVSLDRAELARVRPPVQLYGWDRRSEWLFVEKTESIKMFLLQRQSRITKLQTSMHTLRWINVTLCFMDIVTVTIREHPPYRSFIFRFRCLTNPTE